MKTCGVGSEETRKDVKCRPSRTPAAALRLLNHSDWLFRSDQLPTALRRRPFGLGCTPIRTLSRPVDLLLLCQRCSPLCVVGLARGTRTNLQKWPLSAPAHTPPSLLTASLSLSTLVHPRDDEAWSKPTQLCRTRVELETWRCKRNHLLLIFGVSARYDETPFRNRPALSRLRMPLFHSYLQSHFASTDIDVVWSGLPYVSVNATSV